MQRRMIAAGVGVLAFALAGAAGAQTTNDQLEQGASRVHETGREAASATQAAGGELAQERHEINKDMGWIGENHVENTGTLDVIGVIMGDGVNGQWWHSWKPRLTTVAGANYSRARGVDGSITSFGAEVGLDYFLIGQYNEGLRIGPRVVGSFGVDTTSNSSGFGDVGPGAELGYNFISRQGITGGLAVGWDLRFRGNLGGNTTGDIDGHPYGKANIGYSW